MRSTARTPTRSSEAQMITNPDQETPAADIAAISATNPKAGAFIGQLLVASMSQNVNLSVSLIDSLTEQLADAKARAAAIEYDILRLVGGDFMPTSDALRRALYPSPDWVDSFREDEKDD